jgi:hypothetical protein
MDYKKFDVFDLTISLACIVACLATSNMCVNRDIKAARGHVIEPGKCLVTVISHRQHVMFWTD